MKLAIIGSRTFDDYDKLKEIVDKLLTEENLKVDTIVSGGAKGADTLGEKYALENKLKTDIYLPDWEANGKLAGYIRNEDIINNADFIIAFWNSKSRGTKHAIKLAGDKCKNYWCYHTDTGKIFKYVQLELNFDF